MSRENQFWCQDSKRPTHKKQVINFCTSLDRYSEKDGHTLWHPECGVQRCFTGKVNTLKSPNNVPYRYPSHTTVQREGRTLQHGDFHVKCLPPIPTDTLGYSSKRSFVLFGAEIVFDYRHFALFTLPCLEN